MKYIIGVDGGGSKTAAALADINGNVICTSFASGCNPNDIGFENAMKTIFSAVQAFNVSTDDISAIFCGIAGITASDYSEKANRWLKKTFPNAKSEALHDGINVIYSAFPNSDGAIVICGTGSSCFMKKGGEIIRIGGYGKFDCAGNGYEIGKAAICHALKCVDGRDTGGILNDLVIKKAGGNPLDKLTDLISADKKEIASYTPLVFEAYEKGDMYAAWILETQMEYIGTLINRAAEIYGDTLSVCMAGGIGTNETAVKIIKKYISFDVNIDTVTAEPYYGAVAKAKEILTAE